MLLADSRFTYDLKSIPEIYKTDIYTGDIWKFMQKMGFLAKKISGFEYNALNAEQYLQIQAVVGSNNMRNISTAIRPLLNLHDELSLQYYKSALKINKTVLESVKEKCVPGVSELEIAAEISYLFNINGAQGNAFPPIVAFGKHSASPHAIPTKVKLHQNEVVLIDCGCIYNGINTDVTRTFFVGDKKPALFQQVYEIMEEVIEKVKRVLSNGMSTKGLDLFARDIMRKYTYKGKTMDNFFIHSLGHGVGYELHAYPYLSRQMDARLLTGNIVTIEPGLYFESKFGIRIEDMYLIQENSVKKLTDIHV
ncbi:MAG: M24 family metallopeptidase [Ignavibacteriales bacterium]|nr:M24 family metallopeptidase [Ignavibacteriales bacterium]